MKNLILPLFAIAMIWTACSKTDIAQERAAQEITWTINDGDPTNFVHEINPTRSSLMIEMEPQSVCSGHGVKLTIEVEGNSIFDEIINTFPFTQTFDVNQNSNIKIMTAYDGSEAMIICDLATIIDIKANF